MSDAKQYPERERRARRASAPNGIEPGADACGTDRPVADACGTDRPVADARGSDRGLDLHKQLATPKAAHDKTAADRQIDQLVYELYGLTDDEIRIVEDATRRSHRLSPQRHQDALRNTELQQYSPSIAYTRSGTMIPPYVDHGTTVHFYSSYLHLRAFVTLW
ncbi:MAG: hypothetical protein ABIG44_05030 [Planctomycetota bacterium]